MLYRDNLLSFLSRISNISITNNILKKVIFLKRRILALVLSTAMIFTACSLGKEKPGNDLPGISELGEWDFSITPLSSDAAGVDINTDFRLLSKNDVSADFVKSSLKIFPDTSFEVSQSSSKEFVVKPEKELNDNTVYTFELFDSSNDDSYSWAFQTKTKLGITGSIPGKMSTYVPLNSGIEIMFTHKNIENFEEVFNIEPYVKGTFTSNGYSMIFVPDKLERNTTYKVTINSGAKVKDSNLVLEEPYVFSFTTEASDQGMLFSVSNTFNVFTSSQSHFVPTYVNKRADNYASAEYDVDVYSFTSSDGFLSDMKKYDESYSFTGMYENLKNTAPSNMELVESFKTKPVEVQYGYTSFHSFEMPSSLSPGYYLVRISIDNQEDFAFIQVNDMLVYDSQFEDMHFLWLLNSKDNSPVKDARITIDDEFMGSSIFDGTASISAEYDEEDYFSVNYIKIEAAGFNDFIIRNAQRFIPYYYDYGYERGGSMPYSPASSNYWKYLFTDRSTYLPTDNMNIFGYIQSKSGSNGQYTLSLYSNINGNYLLESKNISLTNTGTFTESFEWEKLTPGWYTLLLEDSDTLVLEHSFYINEYTKPIYKVESSFDKKYIAAGDSINFDLNASFYDGTPVPDMEFTYYMYLDREWSGNLITDSEGNSSVTITPTLNTTNWRPANANMNVYNTKAENYQITDYSSFVFLPKDKMLELAYDSKSATPQIEILAHKLDSSKYSTDYDFSYESLRGAPLNTPLDIKVVETWYDKKEIGQVYDYINKVNRKKYEYIKQTKVVENTTISTSDGKYMLQMPYIKDSNSSFHIEVTLNEGNGEKIVENYYVSYYQGYMDDPLVNFYTLKLEDDKYSYKLNETANYYLDNNGRVDEIAGDKMLVMYLQDGLLRYEIKDNVSGSFAFEQQHIPNILIQAIYAKDGTLNKTSYAQTIAYDYSERNMKITVESDKKDYGPGEQVSLTIATADAAGNPYRADINISIVDEAYFSLYSQNADMLAELYASVYGTGIIKEYVSTENSGGYFDMRTMAEKGGDGADYYVRSDFKDTASFIAVTTDASGKGSVSFKLPDNLTSWRITYQGITDNMEASTGYLNINTKLPFHISTIFSKYFITGDNPSISLRVFGDESEKGRAVSYSVELKKEGSDSIKEIQKDGITGEYTNISLGTLEKGKYTITSYADDKTNRDALQQTFEVLDSTVFFNNKEYYKISTGTSFKPVYSNAEITFFNESESNFYNSLLDLRFASGVRIDQLISAMEARQFIKENFEPDIKLWNESISHYQSYDGGIKLLPYSDSDSLISVRVSLLNTEYFNEASLKTYYYSILQNKDADIHSVVNALTGLAVFREPVLLDIYPLLEDESLSYIDKTILALGLESIGDKTKATAIYKEVLGNTLTTGSKTTVTMSDSEGENHIGAGLLATLAAKLKDYNNGDTLFDYVYENPSIYEISFIEQLTYLKNRNIMDTEEIKALTGRVTVDYSGKEETIEVFGFETRSITVTSSELTAMKIKDVVSDIGAYVYGLGGVEAMKENKVDSYSLKKEYYLNDNASSEFEQSDLIKVVITPDIRESEKGTYQITDFIPAGFRFMRIQSGSHWYDQQEQKLIFYYWDHERSEPITYYIQAVMPGTYKADHTVITKLGHVGTNYTEQETLYVK
jgi:hypothetical protein